MSHIHSNNGLDKTPEIDQVRAALVSQLNGRVESLRNGHDRNGSRRPQREVDAELAAQAHVSPGLVAQARRLARSDNEGLVVAALLGLLPIGTALRGATPPKPNAKYARWQHIVALAGGGQ